MYTKKTLDRARWEAAVSTVAASVIPSHDKATPRCPLNPGSAKPYEELYDNFKHQALSRLTKKSEPCSDGKFSLPPEPLILHDSPAQQEKSRVDIVGGLLFLNDVILDCSEKEIRYAIAPDTKALHVRREATERDRHSCILAGRPVLCAGYITVQAGKISNITNTSMHYAPPAYLLYLSIKSLSLAVFSDSATVTLRETQQTIPITEFIASWESSSAKCADAASHFIDQRTQRISKFWSK